MMLSRNSFSILVVEDDEPKMTAILDVLEEVMPTAQIYQAASVASALDVISKNVIQLAILDMSLPAFDIANDTGGGGEPQDYGGRDVLRFLCDEFSGAHALIVTQYEEFNQNRNSAETETQDLLSISKELREEFGDALIDVLYYSGRRGIWREKLKDVMNQLCKD